MRASGYLCVIAGLVFSSLAFNVHGYKNEAEFSKSLKNVVLDVSSYEHGDLNGDGLADILALMATKAKNGNHYTLYVLVNRGQGYDVAVQSRTMSADGSMCCFVDAPYIRQGSFFVETSGKSSACEHVSATHQFKFYRGEWRLIGARNASVNTCEDENRVFEMDVNLLTGQAIYTERRGDKLVSRTPKKLAVKKRLLPDYDFDPELP